MRKFKNIIFILMVFVCVFVLFTFIRANAEGEHVIGVNTDCTLDVIDNGERSNNKREIMINVNDITPGKRITGFQICNQDDNCNDESNWTDLPDYVSPFINGVGNNSMTIGLMVPIDDIKIRAKFTDFEPIDISYAKFKLTTNNENEYHEVYVDESYNLNNYENTFTNIVTGYKGGDIVLPNNCTDNGCLLKISMLESDYNKIIERLNDFNSNYNDRDMDDKLFLDLVTHNNHLDGRDCDSIYPYEVNNKLYFETVDDKKIFYIIINKFFNDNNRSDFVIADNRNRILSEDYIGIYYKVDRKYFDEADEFLSFTSKNNYTIDATVFYGTPKVQLIVDNQKEIALTATGDASGMGNLKHVYNKIVSGNNDKYPINNNFELTINSFYEQDYTVPLVLKNNDTKVKDVTFVLNRFAFGGNAGGLLVVDSEGNNCMDPQVNQNCREGNYYISTQYRGLVDTFYTTGSSDVLNTFEISRQEHGLDGHFLNNERLYKRNEDFNPWAVAIYYHDDMIVETRSFNLGALVKIEGFSEEVITNDQVNGKVKDNGNYITNYDSSNYNIFGYGLGFEKPINTIKYFNEGSYNRGNIAYTLILGSKEEIIENDINRIALFLTNGELKSDEDNFPELTYGVGEGKIFEVDNRTFDRFGGNN